MHARSEDSWSRWNKAVKSERNDPVKQTRAPDVFNGILYSGLPEDEKSVDRLSQDGFLAITAGGDPIARTLAIGTYYLLTSPQDLRLLCKELDAVMPDRHKLPELAELESLPFLVRHLYLRGHNFFLVHSPLSGSDPFMLVFLHEEMQRHRDVSPQSSLIANKINRQPLSKKPCALLAWRPPGYL
jgi:hypothetical protein